MRPHKAKTARKKASTGRQRRAMAETAAVAPKPTRLDITAAKGRPMLTWVGKRPLSHVTAFPAQRVERHDALRLVGIDADDPKLDRERMQLFRDLRSQMNEECWRDDPSGHPPAPELGGLLFYGDNKDVLAYLIAAGYRHSVKLVYIDPPFDSGADYVRRVALRGVAGRTRIEGDSYSLGEQIQYTDISANDNYLQFMFERLLLIKESMAPESTIYVHADPSRNYQLRMLMDEVFGADAFCNEIVWWYWNKMQGNINRFASNHDTIISYRLGTPGFTKIREQRENVVRQLKRVWDSESGMLVNAKDEDGNLIYIDSAEKSVDDVWRLPMLQPADQTENVGFPTQKPEELLQLVIHSSSRPGDLVLDCFSGAGTTLKVAQESGRRWIGCDINKGAIQTTVKRLRGIIAEQIAEARERAAEARQAKLIETEAEGEPSPKPCAFGFTVWRVNDYDLEIQHNEAVNLACEHIGIERTRSDSYFDGALGRKLVKIIPFGHPLTPLDLEELKRELDARPDEDRNIVVVCLGMELAAKAWIDDWNRLRKGVDAVNKIDVIELRTDPKYGKFIKHEPATARVKIARKKRGDERRIVVAIKDFISPTIIERLHEQAGVLSPKIDDWRAMVDCIYIDTAYSGGVLNVALADVPERKSDLVEGKYELPAPADETTVAVKIIDMLGEEVLVTQKA